MRRKSIYNFFYVLSVLFLIAWIFATIKDLNSSGWFLSLFFLSIALAFRGHKFLKGFSYTVMIFASVSLADELGRLRALVETLPETHPARVAGVAAPVPTIPAPVTVGGAG